MFRIIENVHRSLIEYYTPFLSNEGFNTLDAFPDNDLIPDSVAIQISSMENRPLEIGNTCNLRKFSLNLDIWATSRGRRQTVAALLYEISDEDIQIPFLNFNQNPPQETGKIQFTGSPRYLEIREANQGERGRFRGLVTTTVSAWPKGTGP